MTDGLSAADIMAMTSNNNNQSEMWNNPFIYLVWLAVLGGGGFGGLFGGNRGESAAVQGALTRADLFEGFNNQSVTSELRGLGSGMCDGFYAANTGMLQGFNGLGKEISDNRFAAQQCCCETNRNIDAARYDFSKCCCETNRNIDASRYEAAKNTCDITTAIHNEAEATRALINANTMQELRDRLEDRDRQLMTANFQLSQQSQSAALINELRPCSKPAYITCSPYAAVSPCGGCCGI